MQITRTMTLQKNDMKPWAGTLWPTFNPIIIMGESAARRCDKSGANDEFHKQANPRGNFVTLDHPSSR
jgi:hypothetical protein